MAITFLDKHFWALDNQILYDGCPEDKWITKFFSYPVLYLALIAFLMLCANVIRSLLHLLLVYEKGGVSNSCIAVLKDNFDSCKEEFLLDTFH